MTLFDLAIFIVKLLIYLIMFVGILWVIAITWATINYFKTKSKSKKAFDKQHPVGSTFTTRIKQKLPYGKWKFLGKDQRGFCLYERTK